LGQLIFAKKQFASDIFQKLSILWQKGPRLYNLQNFKINIVTFFFSELVEPLKGIAGISPMVMWYVPAWCKKTVSIRVKAQKGK